MLVKPMAKSIPQGRFGFHSGRAIPPPALLTIRDCSALWKLLFEFACNARSAQLPHHRAGRRSNQTLGASGTHTRIRQGILGPDI